MDYLESPEDREQLLAGYVLGDLTLEEVVRVNQHLASHPELAEEVSRLQATLALLPLSLPETSPPQRLRSQILQAASASAQNGAAKQSNRIRNQSKIWLGLAGSVAAALVLSLGWSNYRLHRQLAIAQAELLRSRTEIATLRDSTLQQELVAAQADLSRYQQLVTLLRQPNNRLLTLKGMTPTSQSSGSLVIAPNRQAAVLTLQNLAPLPKGKLYRLWAFVNGQKVDCAEFTPNSEGKVFLQLPLDNWAGTTAVAITIEPSQGVVKPTGEMVMKGTRSL